jgi:hypothetical protein
VEERRPSKPWVAGSSPARRIARTSRNRSTRRVSASLGRLRLYRSEPLRTAQQWRRLAQNWRIRAHELSDEQLREVIEGWVAEYTRTYPTSKLPELLLAFVNTALQELSRREIAASAQSAAKAASRVLIVAALTLPVAVTTLIVAIVK